MVVKAVNDTAGLNSLVSTLLVFEVYLYMYIKIRQYLVSYKESPLLKKL